MQSIDVLRSEIIVLKLTKITTKYPKITLTTPLMLYFFLNVVLQYFLVIICKKKCVKKSTLNEKAGFGVDDFTSLCIT